jgi:hypothetical protein
LRLRLTLDPEWSQRRWTSIPEILAVGCVVFWLAQCCVFPKLGAPRCELLAGAMLFSAFDTVNGILNGFMCICGGGGERLRKMVEGMAISNFIFGYSFIFSTVTALLIAVPTPRDSAPRFWVRVLTAVITVNVGLVVWFSCWFATVLSLAQSYYSPR